MKIFKLKYEQISTKVPDHFRLDGWTTGIKQRKFCSLLFPKRFSMCLAIKIIRRKLSVVSLDYGEL